MKLPDEADFIDASAIAELRAHVMRSIKSVTVEEAEAIIVRDCTDERVENAGWDELAALLMGLGVFVMRQDAPIERKMPWDTTAGPIVMEPRGTERKTAPEPMPLWLEPPF